MKMEKDRMDSSTYCRISGPDSGKADTEKTAEAPEKASEKVMHSSSHFGWQDVLVETRLHSGGQFEYEKFQDHLVSVHLGAPISLERKWTSKGISREQIKREKLESGAIIVVPAEQPSFWRHTESSHFLNITLSTSLMNQLTERLTRHRASRVGGANTDSFYDTHTEQIARRLQREAKSGAPNGSLYAETLAAVLCVYLLNRSAAQTGGGRHPPAKASLSRWEAGRAIAYIQDNLETTLSLKAIAQELGMSTYHFAHLFTRVFGVPPHQYVIKTRIERAKVLILQKSHSFGDVALMVGFADQSHFSRHFKRLVGMTPRAFARHHCSTQFCPT